MLKVIIFQAMLLLALMNVAVAQVVSADIKRAMQSDDYQLAADLINKALQVDPANEVYLYLKGSAITKSGDIDKAIWYYQNLLDLVNDKVKPALLIADIYRIQGQNGKRVDALEAIIKNHPDDARAYELLGDYYATQAKRYYNGANKLDATDDRRNKVQLLDAAVLKSDTQSFVPPIVRNQKLITSKTQRKKEAFVPQTPKAASKQPVAENKTVAVQQKVVGAEDAQLIRDQVVNFLRSWSQAWSNREPKRYFDHYASEYIPANGSSIQNWVDQRTIRIVNKDYIDIKLENIRIATPNINEAVARFDQHYASNRFNGNSRKQLIVKRDDDGNWRIVAEQEL